MNLESRQILIIKVYIFSVFFKYAFMEHISVVSRWNKERPK